MRIFSPVSLALALSAAAMLAQPNSSAAAVIVYDAATDLLANSSSNPNGVWTYGGYSAAGTTVTSSTGTFNAFADPSQHHSDWSPGFDGWAVGGSVAVPAIEVNTTAGGLSPCCGITPIDSHAIFMHPGPSSGPQDDVAILWTASAPGLIDISANFIQRHDNAQLAEVAVNGVIVFASNATTGSGTSYNATAVSVLTGDTVSFIVNNSNFYGAGATQVAGTVTFVPEPGSLVLLGLGAVGLFAVARRRKA